MLENKFFLLLINFLWMAGLFGALFALVYMVQYRRQHWWSIGYTYNVPRLLVPLYGALLLFVLGLSLHAYVAQRAISPWVALVWGLLALFLLFRLVGVMLAGLQNGWDNVLPTAPIGESQRLPVWAGSVVTLLLANVLLLGWWGSTQLQAGAVTLPWAAQGRAKSSVTTESTPFAFTQANKPSALTTETPSSVIPVILLTPILTGTLAPAVSTLDASDLKVTATPAASAAVAEVMVTATPVLSATAALILVPTATLTPAPTPFISVASETGAKVRTAPTLDAAVITLLPAAATAPVLGRTADGQWFSLQLPDGTQGWMAAEVVKLNGELTRVPVVASP